MKLSLKNRLSQKLTLTPQMAMSLKVLTMNRIELDRYLEECVESNPLLEIEPAEQIEGQQLQKSIVEQSGDDRWEQMYRPLDETDPFDRFAHVAERPSLYESLIRQLDQQPMSEQDRRIAHAIVDALDEDGLFRADIIAFAKELQIHPSDAERVLLNHVQQLEPPGIGARNLTECLLLQLDPREPTDRLASTLLVHFRDRLDMDRAKLAREVGVSIQQIEAAFERMRRLDPFPGHDAGGQEPIYIEPEIVFQRNDENGFDVIVPRSARYRLRIHDRWSENALSNEDRAYVERALREARWLMQSLSQRRETLLKLGISLARRQRRMLEAGFLAIQPLTMREVAEDIGVHESTISRVVQGKYAGTPFGIIPLKSFFSAGLQTRDGHAISTSQVLQRIRSLIETEPPGRPISDQKIAERLRMEGIEIARRTVAKYREQMGLPSSSQRRRKRACSSSQTRR
ncbi:MAG: RNA polymerase sigma-54 factor [Zetaproteobacteria bacterium]|nr:MAG: RNA polymerase sigma-54 factor [Zetaproteobacteria bacterium]